MTNAIKHYISLTVADRDGRTSMNASFSEGLPEDSFLSKLGGALASDLRSGEISDRVEVDLDRDGEAMITLEEDGADGVDISIVFNPTVTLADGDLSGAQGLALSALQRVQHRLGLPMTELNVTTD